MKELAELPAMGALSDEDVNWRPALAIGLYMDGTMSHCSC